MVTDLRNDFNVFLCRGQYFKYSVPINSKISLDNVEVSYEKNFSTLFLVTLNGVYDLE